MRVGDRVRVVSVWAWPSIDNLDDEEIKTRMVFERSIGRVFPIIDITPEGHVELEVGEVVCVAPYLHSIWLEVGHLELVENSN